MSEYRIRCEINTCDVLDLTCINSSNSLSINGYIRMFRDQRKKMGVSASDTQITRKYSDLVAKTVQLYLNNENS